MRCDGLRGGGVEQGGFAVVRSGTGNRRGYWTRGVPSVPSEARTGVFRGQLNSGRALARRQARSTSSWFTHSCLFFNPDLAADASPPAQRSCATGRHIW